VGIVTEVVIAGWMDYADRAAVLAACRALTEQTQAEPGCLGYAFSADAQNPDRIRVFEWWTSQEALDAHLRTQHVQDFRDVVSGIDRTGRDLHRFAVSDAQRF
jgi:quinol monooxygenase YgiN